MQRPFICTFRNPMKTQNRSHCKYSGAAGQKRKQKTNEKIKEKEKALTQHDEPRNL